MKSFAIGKSKEESVVVAVLGYERPATGEFYDDNWLHCEVSVYAGAFRGTFDANFLTSELESLLHGLRKLHQELCGEYSFDPMEGQLVFKAKCDSLGHLEIEGEAMDQAGVGHTLSFSLSLDQTYLSETLRQLSDVAVAFPVRA